ncbi:GD16734 [Drosophila simulans]|uniref:GD16734 n=1 Tax=Drosophila simulans TaxID=7240 RepID=B4R4Y9_DROSI|nr:GD16734 [Drosophila simulans]
MLVPRRGSSDHRRSSTSTTTTTTKTIGGSLIIGGEASAQHQHLVTHHLQTHSQPSQQRRVSTMDIITEERIV